MQDKFHKKFVQVYSTRNIGTSPSGSVDFIHASSSTTYSDILNSFMNVTIEYNPAVLNGLQNDGAGNTRALNRGIASLPLCGLFKQGTLRINDIDASFIQEFHTHVLNTKLLNSTKDMEARSGNPLDVLDMDVHYSSTIGDGAGVAGAAVSALVPFLSQTHNVRTRNRRLVYRDSAGYNTSTLSNAGPYVIQLCMENPFLQALKDPNFVLPPNNKVSLSLNFNSNYLLEMFFSELQETDRTRFNITDISWHIPVYESNIPRSLNNVNYEYVEVFSQKGDFKNLLTIDIPRSTHRIALSFTRLPVAGHDNLINYPTPNMATANVQSNYMTTPWTYLSTLNVTFGSQTWPTGGYNFASQSVQDVKRAYEHYLEYSNAKDKREQPVISSFEEYYNCPVFVFLSDVPMNSQRGTATLVITSSATSYTDVQYNLTCEHTKQLIIEYDDNTGMVTNTKSIDML